MTEFVTASDGVRIAYEALGEGKPVLLIHGFASSRAVNWQKPGWYDWLTGKGFRVIAFDNRGHGESDKPHDIAAYDESTMAGDALAVLDALNIKTTYVVGYSMGAFLAVRLLHDNPARLGRAVLGGIGGNYFTFGNHSGKVIAHALTTDDLDTIEHAQAREFRRFSDRVGNDNAALAACIRRPRIIFTPGQLSKIANPVLVVDGEKDDMIGDPAPFASAFGHGRLIVIPGRDHHRTVGDPAFKQAVTDFLK